MLEADRLRLERRYEDAEAAYADALEHAQKLGTNSLPVALTLNNIGYHYQSLGRFLQAERALARSLEVYERTLGAASHMSIQVATNLSGIYVDTGRLSKAESLARRFLGVGDDLSPEDTASMQAVLGTVLLSRQNLGEAEMMFRRAMAFFERDTRQEALESTVITLSHLAIICLRTNRPAEARAHSGRARTPARCDEGSTASDLGQDTGKCGCHFGGNRRPGRDRIAVSVRGLSM
jgi:Flp pilus assembly protein TadD